jgi:hypothetical protein
MAEYITQPDAETYLSSKPGSDSWLALDVDVQQQYLTESYRMISTDSLYTIPENPSAEQLLKLGPAQAENAYFLFTNSGNAQIQQNINLGMKRYKALSYEEEYFEGGAMDANSGKTQYNTIVNNLLDEFIKIDSWVGNREIV